MFHFRCEALGHILKPKKERANRRVKCWGSLLGSFRERDTFSSRRDVWKADCHADRRLDIKWDLGVVFCLCSLFLLSVRNQSPADESDGYRNKEGRQLNWHRAGVFRAPERRIRDKGSSEWSLRKLWQEKARRVSWWDEEKQWRDEGGQKWWCDKEQGNQN